MHDARVFVDTLEGAERVLEGKLAEFRGRYNIQDIIYASLDEEVTLDKVFLRLRINHKEIWGNKRAVVALKETEQQDVGKKSRVPVYQEFDSVVEAEQFIADHYADRFQKDFEFTREGWQYNLGDDQVDLEQCGEHCTIEFKSRTQDGLKSLLSDFRISTDQVLKGPSVTAFRAIIKG